MPCFVWNKLITISYIYVVTTIVHAQHHKHCLKTTHESTYFPPFPNCFKMLNCLSMIVKNLSPLWSPYMYTPVKKRIVASFHGEYFEFNKQAESFRLVSARVSSWRLHICAHTSLTLRKRKLPNAWGERHFHIMLWKSCSHQWSKLKLIYFLWVQYWAWFAMLF